LLHRSGGKVEAWTGIARADLLTIVGSRATGGLIDVASLFRYTGGIEPSDAMATLSQQFLSIGQIVSAVPNSSNCASGQAEVDTYTLKPSGTTTAGTAIQAVRQDAGSR
jgi:hypothetical protein